ncbi:HAD family hydrolase [Hyunsoonleella sp. SJ7]|uniref:HAD family hydrolase n=1 Tax=Hyunsoonleella aquatilis TaxID=2762758 RepID=A0A923HAE4_9FLAO|nr:HAD family hydrolase [Hyunsoonleella aquatilis]MBC3759775.1 HAD family hydrolase [Hyunsoonleella aquatilis]
MDTKPKPIVIFDLDDTLYNELDYLKSAFLEIAQYINKDSDNDVASIFEEMMRLYHSKSNVFVEILNRYDTKATKEELLHLYRNHSPNIKLSDERKLVLDFLKNKGVKMGLLTDGRSRQQRSKIKALGLDEYFTEIVISEEFGSEKPNENNFLYFEKAFGIGQYFYIGDNVSKDFLSPNRLGWTSVCIIDNGDNIHKQDFSLERAYLPTFTLKDFRDIIKVLD